MLVQRRRRWANIETALGECLALLGDLLQAREERHTAAAPGDVVGH